MWLLLLVAAQEYSWKCKENNENWEHTDECPPDAEWGCDAPCSLESGMRATWLRDWKACAEDTAVYGANKVPALCCELIAEGSDEVSESSFGPKVGDCSKVVAESLCGAAPVADDKRCTFDQLRKTIDAPAGDPCVALAACGTMYGRDILASFEDAAKSNSEAVATGCCMAVANDPMMTFSINGNGAAWIEGCASSCAGGRTSEINGKTMWDAAYVCGSVADLRTKRGECEAAGTLGGSGGSSKATAAPTDSFAAVAGLLALLTV